MWGKIGITSPKLFRRAANCRYPLHLPPKTALDLLKLRPPVSERTVHVNDWKMESTHAGCNAYCDAVSRNLDRALRRWVWQLAATKVVDGRPIRMETEHITDETSGAEFYSPVSGLDSARHSNFPVLDSEGGENGREQRGVFSGNPPTPERAGSIPDAPFRNAGGRPRLMLVRATTRPLRWNIVWGILTSALWPTSRIRIFSTLGHILYVAGRRIRPSFQWGAP